jgi:hypothetical protein
MLINIVFLAHAALAFVLAFFLLFFTQYFTLLVVEDPAFTWPAPGVLEDVIVAYAQLTAVGLILIGIATSIARISGYSVVRWAALIALVLIGLVFILVSLFLKVEPLDQWVLWINVVFVALYVWVWFFYRETV